MTDTNRRVLLKSRPQGEPTKANFDVVDAPLPEPKDGEYLSRTIWLSASNSGAARPENLKVPPKF